MSLGRYIKEQVVAHGRESAVRSIRDALNTGKISNDELSYRDLAENLMGSGWYQKLEAYRGGATHGQESADAVDASTFAAITGNQLIDTVHAKYNSPEFIGDKLTSKIPVTNGNVDTQKEPWLSDIMPRSGSLIDSAGYRVSPGMPYGDAEFLPNYILLRALQGKRGLTCHVTMEMIYSDRTRQARQSAESVGAFVARLKEFEILRMVLGLDVGFTAKFAPMTAEGSSPTYVTDESSANTAFPTRWTNGLDSTPLTSWFDLNTVEQLFAQMRDPSTGAPIEVDANTILVMPARVHTAMNILHATQIRVGDGAVSGISGNTSTYAKNPLKQYEVLSSKHAYYVATNPGIPAGGATTAGWPSQDYVDDTPNTILTATAAQVNDLWLVGNFPKAFYYREALPFQTFQAPPQNPDEFKRDIVISVKAREWGVAGVLDPRYVVRAWGHNFETQAD